MRNTHNLRQIQRVISYGVEDQILELVNYTEEIVAEGSHVVDSPGWQRVIYANVLCGTFDGNKQKSSRDLTCSDRPRTEERRTTAS